MRGGWLGSLAGNTVAKAAAGAWGALAIEPVAMRSAKRAAWPNGADRPTRSTCRGYLRARAAVVLIARVAAPEPPLAEQKATIGPADRVGRSASSRSTAQCPSTSRRTR